MTISSGKEGIDSLWCDMEVEIGKISPLDIAAQMLIEGKVLDDHVFDILEHFCQINECNEIHWLLLTVLEKVGKEKDALRASNSQLKLHVNDLKCSVFVLKKSLSPVAAELRLVKTTPRVSSYK